MILKPVASIIDQHRTSIYLNLKDASQSPAVGITYSDNTGATQGIILLSGTIDVQLQALIIALQGGNTVGLASYDKTIVDNVVTEVALYNLNCLNWYFQYMMLGGAVGGVLSGRPYMCVPTNITGNICSAVIQWGWEPKEFTVAI